MTMFCHLTTSHHHLIMNVNDYLVRIAVQLRLRTFTRLRPHVLNDNDQGLTLKVMDPVHIVLDLTDISS